MNLTQAFKRRNKLQNELNDLRAMYSNSTLIREENEPEHVDKLNGMTCKEWLNTIAFKENNLESLIAMIDEANKNIKPTLSKIQHLKNAKNFREKLLRDLRYNAGEKRYFDDKTINYVLNLDPKALYEDIKQIEKEIELLEDKVSNYNATTLINDGKVEERK